MNAKRTVRRIRKSPRGGKTDWARVEALTGQELEKAIESDPDAAPMLDRKWFETARVVLPERKIPLALRVDRDVVQWFKLQGPRYQTRMNAVLRAYMEAHKKTPRERKQRA
jgi:uncharacterized protein (DUF4415 family)